jgi:hypothetical protein
MHTAGIPKGSAPKVRNSTRGPGYWISLSNSRSARPGRVVIHRPNRDWPFTSDTGSAAYRRLHS